ncbi:flavodoxin [Collinsella sp. An2]|uniref:flavodoxin n=1 Tax=Collinsella sp. An2 TaxID=1965585 RepID=UPI000B37F4A3|nr:flavodoxin [Collinsella sp. An2]OUP11080.1 flavodoxin [Collinsella sp. An2]
MTRPLIAYFSRAGQNYVNGQVRALAVGNTEVVARMIAEETGGDLFRIETVHEYAVDYTECTEEAADEKRLKARPKLRALPKNIDDYDTVILGYPNWWGTMPMAVYTFLESFDFTNKVIMPFCTHEGSGLSGTERDIARTCPGAEVVAGLAIHGADAAHARSQVQAWLAHNGF